MYCLRRRALPARLCETPHFIVSHPMPVSLWIIVLAALALIALALFALFTRLERGLRDEIAEAGRARRGIQCQLCAIPADGHGAAHAIFCASKQCVESTVNAACARSEEHTSELQSPDQLVCRL